MLDIHWFRSAFDEVQRGVAKKHFACNLEKVRQLDTERIVHLKAYESARAEQQLANKRMASLDKQSEEFQTLVQSLKPLSVHVKQLEETYHCAEQLFLKEWLAVPNVPHTSVPIGKDAQDNQEIYQWQPSQNPSNDAYPHFDIPNFERWLNFRRGTQVMGAGFPFYIGPVARLVRALIAFFLEEAYAHGYLELLTPLMVNAASATATGQLPDKEGMMYATQEGYLIPTAEVPVTNFVRDEILDEAELPKKCCAYSACFRREAGSWGKEVRGLNRLHQFDKVELVQWTLPETSFDCLESLKKDAEILLQKLDLPYRILSICTGDMGFSHAKQYDLEVWAAGQKRWLEVSSCSNFTDFQARRANIRYRRQQGDLRFVHTLNGSALAVPRVLAAILENNFQSNGRVKIPSVLHKWLPETEVEF
ncbi:MAG: serine--tRNA ligase [Puniceicoccales bacterium]|jgi:seryl-tRNA synthetase|nr:serine--tRNA ligase [Puniceicoccales bacterium]